MIKENNDENLNNEEISLKELIIKIKKWFLFLKKKWIIILTISLIGFFAGMILAILDKPNYKATLTFSLEEDKGGGSGVSGALGLASSLGFDLGGGGGGVFAATNIIELMKSKLIVEKALLNPIKINNKTISYAEYYIDLNNLRKNWANDPKLKDVRLTINGDIDNFTIQQLTALKYLYNLITDKKNLVISQKDKKVTILTLEINSISESFSKLFCENLANEISKYYIETKSKKAKNNLDLLQKQLDSVRTELNGAILGVATENDNVYNLNPAFNKKATPSKKRQIDIQANTTVFSQLLAQVEVAKVTLRKETPLIQIIDKPYFPLENQVLNIKNTSLFGGFIGFFISLISLTISMELKKLFEKQEN